jgi:hypothetical protein
MTALEILTARAPCYKPSAGIVTLLTLAEAETSTAYGTHRPTAVALLTLHWLALQERGKGGSAGQLTSESEGDLSRTYAAPVAGSSSDGSLSSTSWGQELLRLRRGCILGIRTRQIEAC